jgi:hypothetical protein
MELGLDAYFELASFYNHVLAIKEFDLFHGSLILKMECPFASLFFVFFFLPLQWSDNTSDVRTTVSKVYCPSVHMALPFLLAKNYKNLLVGIKNDHECFGFNFTI